MTENYTSEGLRYGLQVVYENQFQLKCVQKKSRLGKVQVSPFFLVQVQPYFTCLYLTCHN